MSKVENIPIEEIQKRSWVQMHKPSLLDYGSWMTNLFMQYVYDSSFFTFVYHWYKALYGFITNSTEIYRICDAVVIASFKEDGTAIRETVFPDDSDPSEWTMIQARKIELLPEVLIRMDLCIFYSSKLDVEFRRPFESWRLHLEETSDAYMEPGTGNRFEELFELLCTLKKFPPIVNLVIPPQRLVLRSGLTEIVSTFHLLHELNKRAATRYELNVPANETRLLELWVLMMPQDPLIHRFSTQWQKIGFQGKDPSTDFRAMGLLAFDNMCYFAEKHISNVKRILTASHKEISWFSYALVSIYVTAYCLRLVRTRQLQWVFYCHGATKEIFNEFYCWVFDAFEVYWSSQKKTPTVMEFNALFRNFQMEIEVHLMQKKPVFLIERTKRSISNRRYSKNIKSKSE